MVVVVVAVVVVVVGAVVVDGFTVVDLAVVVAIWLGQVLLAIIFVGVFRELQISSRASC